MKIDVTTTVARSVQEVWAAVADDFTAIHRWSDGVFTSDALTDINGTTEAPIAGRYCTFTEDPKGLAAREIIRHYDKTNHRLEFEVLPNRSSASQPLTRNYVTITLAANGPSETQMRWVSTPSVNMVGYLMYPLIQLGLTKTFRGILKELKDDIEGAAVA